MEKLLNNNIQTSLEQAEKIIDELQSSFQMFMSRQDPKNIPEIRQTYLRECYKSWGRFGWTTPPEASLSEFSNISPPTTLKEADALMMPYLSDHAVSNIFDALQEYRLNPYNLNEAISCYNYGLYTACASLIFGLFDFKVLSMQQMPAKGKKSRDVGRGGANRIIGQYNDETTLYNSFFLITLLNDNILSCCEAFFRHGGDFKKEPHLINRNFISHGMNKLPPTKTDCIKLFLLLYNFSEFLEHYALVLEANASEY